MLRGLVIPAHPLALTSRRKLDEKRQRALTRYYLSAGAGGVAVGVHTTQFAIRDPKHALFRPVLELAAETVRACDDRTGRKTARIAGICGRTAQAVSEASVARDVGYHAGLLSLAAWKGELESDVLAHCRTVAAEIPLFGFYLQPAVGGRVLSARFWRQFAQIPNVVAIKMAPFNRYQTLDVLRGVAESGRAHEIALYTGNDDNIVADLLTGFEMPGGDRGKLRIVGGLLGQWACWTHKAVDLLDQCQKAQKNPKLYPRLLTTGAQLTECNAAIFDVAHNFAGCIAGIHEVLKSQGILANVLTLDPHEKLSPGQKAEIHRVSRAYPHLHDNDFVSEHLDVWMA